MDNDKVDINSIITDVDLPSYILDYKNTCLNYYNEQHKAIIQHLHIISQNLNMKNFSEISDIKKTYLHLKAKLNNEYGIAIFDQIKKSFNPQYVNVVKKFFNIDKKDHILFNNPYYLFNSLKFSKLGFVYIPSKISCEIPIGLYTKLLFEWPERVLVFVNTDSKISVTDGCFSNLIKLQEFEISVFHFILKKSSNLNLAKILNWTSNITNACIFIFEIEDNSNVNFLYADIGQSKNLSNIIIDFKNSKDALFNLYAFQNQNVSILNNSLSNYRFYDLNEIKDNREKLENLLSIFPYEITSELALYLGYLI